MESELTEMMTDHVAWEPLLSIDGRNRKTYGPPTDPDILCYWEQKQTTRWVNGTITEIGGIIYCGGVFAVDINDRLTLPNGKQPDIVMIETFPDENGPYATVITVGR